MTSLTNIRIVTCLDINDNNMKYYVDCHEMDKLIISLLKLHQQSFSDATHISYRLKYLYVSIPTLIGPAWWPMHESNVTIIKEWQDNVIYMSSQMHAQYIEQADTEYVFDTGSLLMERTTHEISSYVHNKYQSAVDVSRENNTFVKLYRSDDYGSPKII